MTHTPTPWERVGQYISDGDCGEIASTADSNFSYDTDLANAAHIVKCVNLHDELVEVLKWISDNSMCEGAVFASSEALNKAGSL